MGAPAALPAVAGGYAGAGRYVANSAGTVHVAKREAEPTADAGLLYGAYGYGGLGYAGLGYGYAAPAVYGYSTLGYGGLGYGYSGLGYAGYGLGYGYGLGGVLYG